MLFCTGRDYKTVSDEKWCFHGVQSVLFEDYEYYLRNFGTEMLEILHCNKQKTYVFFSLSLRFDSSRVFFSENFLISTIYEIFSMRL